MGPLLVRLWRYAQTPPGQRYLKYFAGSVICTVVSFVALTLSYGVFRWWSEVPSAVFANGVATIPSYYLNRNWTWGKSGRSQVWREMLPFWVTSAIGIALSMGAAAVARHVSVENHLHHLASTVVVDGANLLTFVVLWVGKFLVFNRLFRVGGPVPDDPELVKAA